MNKENTTTGREDARIFVYWRLIKKWHRSIGIFVSACVLVTIIISLLMTNIYAAKAIIIPVSSREISGSGMAATLMQQVGGLSGISLPESVSETEIITLLKSTTLREEIITRYHLLPVLFPEKWDKKRKRGEKTGIPSSILFFWPSDLVHGSVRPKKMNLPANMAYLLSGTV